MATNVHEEYYKDYVIVGVPEDKAKGEVLCHQVMRCSRSNIKSLLGFGEEKVPYMYLCIEHYVLYASGCNGSDTARYTN